MCQRHRDRCGVSGALEVQGTHIYLYGQRQHQNDSTVEIYVAVEVADANVCMNRSSFCHSTQCLRQENIDIVALCNPVNGP